LKPHETTKIAKIAIDTEFITQFKKKRVLNVNRAWKDEHFEHNEGK